MLKSAQIKVHLSVTKCKIKGIRTAAFQDTIPDSDPDPNFRWIKIEWAEYAVQEKQILEWMNTSKLANYWRMFTPTQIQMRIRLETEPILLRCDSR